VSDRELELGVDVGGTKMLLVARHRAGALAAEHRVPTGPDVTGTWLEREIRRFADGLDRPVRTVAVAVPGLVAGNTQVVSCDVLPRLAGWRPPVDLVVNDIRAALASALDAEWTAATGPLLCVVAGTAIGAAYTDTSGRTFEGAGGWAGELGYLPVSASTDGQVQRLDHLAGGSALLAALGASAAEVHRRLERGDRVARDAVEQAGRALGLGLAACINLLNPAVVVLGGGTCRFPGYREAAMRTAHAHTIPALWAQLRVGHFRDEQRFAADGAVAAVRGR
jgi:glucokinase